ncbi:MAG: J domain-containing protein [Deltaproteobacteria bacterium]|nr:J domain-containing protein [Deltaproteobacteria bacterium]
MRDSIHQPQPVHAGSIVLPSLLCRLAQQGWSGQTRIGSLWMVELDGHRIRALTLPDDDLSLGQLLVARGLVHPDTIEAAATSARKQDRLQGQILVSWGLPQHRLWDALFEQASRRFASLLDRASGSVALQPTQHLAIRRTLGVPLDLRQAISNWIIQRTGQTKLQHWMHLHGGKRFTPTNPLSTWFAANRPALHTLLQALRDGHTLSDVLSRQPDEEALKFLYALSFLGILQDRRTRTRRGSSRQTSVRPKRSTTTSRIKSHPGASPVDSSRSARNNTPHEASAGSWPGPRTTKPAGSRVATDEQPPMDPSALRLWWHKMARRYHPDLNGSGDETLERFMEIQRLYQNTLRNAE